LNLLAEVCATQERLFGKVSSYYTQGLSDTLFQIIRGVHHGPKRSLLYRTLFFKSVWVWLNLQDQNWLRIGLMDRNIARSGPIQRDEIEDANWIDEAKEIVDPKRTREIFKRLYRLVPKSWR
jgi:hypothetical protein